MSGRRARRREWIRGAIRQPAGLRRTLGFGPDELIPRDALEAAADTPGKLGRQARAAIGLRKITRRRRR